MNTGKIRLLISSRKLAYIENMLTGVEKVLVNENNHIDLEVYINYQTDRLSRQFSSLDAESPLIAAAVTDQWYVYPFRILYKF